MRESVGGGVPDTSRKIQSYLIQMREKLLKNGLDFPPNERKLSINPLPPEKNSLQKPFNTQPLV